MVSIKLFAIWASVIVLINTTQGAKNCGTNPSTIVLKRGEKITIEYWNPPPELDEFNPTQQELYELLNDEPRTDEEPVNQIREEATTVRDVTDAEVNVPTNTEPPADEPSPGVALTVERDSEFETSTESRAEGSGSDEVTLNDAPVERQGLESSGEAPEELVVLTNFEETMMNDDTMQFAIESENLHPVKALKEKEAIVLRATTEAVPVVDTTPADVEGSGDVLLADAPAVEGSGDVTLDLPGPHTFDEDFTMTKALPEPETQTEVTTDNVMAVDDTPAEFRGDDILISRIRTIVNSLTNAKPLFRRTTGLLSSVFSRRSKRDVSNDFYRSHEFKQFLRSQPLPVRRALSPNFAGRFSRKIDEQSSLVEDECDLHIKTDPGLHLLMTFHNLSAPYTVDCAGAYVEIEREGNGFEARWCGNPVGQERGSRSHVIFARSEVRVSVFNNREMLREKMVDEKTTRHLIEPLPPTGFTADIEVIDLHDAGQYTAFQRSQAYSSVNRRMG